MLSGLPRTQGVPLPRGKSSPGRSQSTVHSEILSHKGNTAPIQSLSCLLLHGIPILFLAYHPALPDLTLGKYFPFPDDARYPSREPPLFLQVLLPSFLSTLLPLCSLVESHIQPSPLPSKVTPKVQTSLQSHTASFPTPARVLPWLLFWFLLVLSPTGMGQVPCLLCKTWGAPDLCRDR